MTEFRFWIALGALGWRFANPLVRLGEHVVDAQSCRLSNFLYRARPRDLARVPVQVIRTFDLPLQPHVYPAARATSTLRCRAGSSGSRAAFAVGFKDGMSPMREGASAPLDRPGAAGVLQNAAPERAGSECAGGGRVRHILLITRSFPPLNVVSSHRMYQWVKYWSRAGVRVSVLTTEKHWFLGPCDLDSLPLANVEVVEVAFLPRALVRLLARSRRAPPDPAADRPRGAADAAPARLVQFKAWLRRRRLAARLLPDVEFYDLWIAKAVRAGARILATEPVDVIVSSFGPPAAHKIAARLKRQRPDIPWVADYRDPWTFCENFDRRGVTGFLERRRECASVGRHADLLVCVSEPLAEQTRRFTSQPVVVMTNGFDPEEDTAGPAPAVSALRNQLTPATLVYTGTLHLACQDPSPLLRVIGEMVRRGEWSADAQVVFFGDRNVGLQRLIEAEGVAREVRVLGYVDRPTALWAQRRATALLLIENQASAAHGVLRAKMFEYLQAGRPILGIGFETGTEVARILIEAGVGIVCGSNPARIRDALRALQAADAGAAFAPVPAVLARYRRDVQAQELLGTLEALRAGRLAGTAWRRPPPGGGG